MKKLIYFLSLAIILSACTTEKRYKIGVSQCSREDWRQLLNDELEREVLFHTDIDIEILSADNDNEKQIRDLEYFVKNDFDIIMVCPNEAEAITPIVKKIHEAGIPVIVFDRDTNEECYSAYISADNVSIGKDASEYMLSKCEGPLKIVEIYGVNGSLPAIRRSKGFHEGIKNDSARAEVVATEYGRWSYSEALRKVDSLLDAGVDFNVIFAHNDRMAIAASDALTKRGLRDKVTIIGIDGVPTIGINAVSEGKIDATFFYPTGGKVMMETALKLLHDKNYFIDTILPSQTVIERDNASQLLAIQSMVNSENQRLSEVKHAMQEYLKSRASRQNLIYSGIIILILVVAIVIISVKYINLKRNTGREIERMKQDYKYRRAQLETELQELRALHNRFGSSEITM